MSVEQVRLRNNNIATVIGIVLFAVAVFRLPVGLGHGREFLLGMFKVGVLVGFVVLLCSINKWVGAFLVLAVISRTFPTLTVESQAALSNILFGLGWYFVVFHFADTEFVMDVICVIGFAHFLATIVQSYNITSVFVGPTCGLVFNPNEASALFALCFPAFLREGRKKFLPVIILSLGMITSFNGVLAVAVGGCLYVAVTISQWVILPIAIGAGLFLFLDKPQVGVRYYAWKNALISWSNDSWGIGCGVGHWKTIAILMAENGEYLAEKGTVWGRLHNTFIQNLVEMGVGSGVITLGYLTNLFRRATRKALVPVIALVVVLVCCSTNSMFRMNAFNGMMAITWLAILERTLCNQLQS